jgi:hypothetical protein
MAMRCAAAEAWCAALAADEEIPDVLDRLAPAGRALEASRAPPQIRAELMRSLARHIPPARRN